MAYVYLITESPDDAGTQSQIVCDSVQAAEQIKGEWISEKIDEILHDHGDVVSPPTAEDVLSDDYNYRITIEKIGFVRGTNDQPTENHRYQAPSATRQTA